MPKDHWQSGRIRKKLRGWSYEQQKEHEYRDDCVIDEWIRMTEEQRSRSASGRRKKTKDITPRTYSGRLTGKVRQKIQTMLDVLPQLGLEVFADYQKTRTWQEIRLAVMERSGGLCEVCGRGPVEEVHPRCYNLLALKGQDLRYHIACCRGCYTAAHSPGVSDDEAPAVMSERLAQMARKQGRSLYGLCAVCAINPVREGTTACRRCVRAR